MTEFVIRHAEDGAYLETYDPDWLPTPRPDPVVQTGLARWTDDPTKAYRFATFVEASDCWRATSTVLPTRPDGRPNRPLTAYNVLIETAP